MENRSVGESDRSAGDEVRAPCGECGERISVEASVCPVCGYNPYREQLGGGLGYLMLGALLSVLVITAVIGIPIMALGAWSMFKTWRRKPTPTDAE